MRLTKIFLMIALFALAGAPLASAVAPPAVKIADALGNSVIIDTTGTVTCTGTCTQDMTPIVAPGKVAWAGSVGNFSINIVAGQSKPILTSPQLLLGLFIETFDTGGTVTVSWSDTGFTGSGPMTFTAADTLNGNVNATYSGYFDTTNTLFGTGTLVGSFSHSGFGQATTVTGPGPVSQPFSMTEVVVADMQPNGEFSLGGVRLKGTPGCSGTIGDFVWKDLNNDGLQNNGETGINGVIVQLYKGAIIPANLVGTTTTATAPAGYAFLPPNSDGYYQFTGLCTGDYNVVIDSNQPNLSGYLPSPVQAGFPTNAAIDSNGSPAPVNLPTDNSTNTTIDFGFVPLSPLVLKCATSTGEVGVPYNSALVATGGASPYTYSISVGALPDGLVLDVNTGAITGTPTNPGTFNFTAKVVDSSGLAAGTITSNCSITIVPPPSVICSASNTGEVGVPFNSPAMSVSGGTAPFTFSVGSGSVPAGLTLNTSTGAITGTPTAPGSFAIKVTDANGVVAPGTCPFTIVAPPSVACSTTNTGEVGAAFNSPAMSITGGTAPFTFSVATGTIPAGLALNASTGAITGTPTAAGTFTIKVTDANGVVAPGTCPFTIVPAPSVICSTTNTGEVGLAFNSPAMSVSGGTAPFTFSIATGALPAGLTLDASTGAITGTPTAAGTFTIKLTDANGVVAPGTCPFTIVPAPSVICSTTNTGEIGVAFNSPAMSVSGGTAPFTFSIATGTLPAGLTLNASTGAITGTPTAAGTFTIKLTDANGVVAPGTCPFTIVPAPSIICSTTNTGEVGVAFTSPAMSVSGGTAPFTFSIATGTLPAGLTLDATTGAITGTPTAAGTFTIKLTDANGVVAPGTCPFTIVPAPSVICSTTNTGEVGVAFTSPAMSVSGGTAPFTFSIATGTLPAGLTLNPSTGAITGTPIAAGTFTIKLTDANGVVAPGTCPFTIVPAPSVICSTTNTGEVGIAFNSPAMSVSGGTAPFTFSIATGTLPAGLTLNPSTGAITGTPTAAGTFTVKLTDANGVVAPGTCPFTIVPAPSVICSTTNTGEVGVAFTSPAMSVSGGTAPFTFSIATGTFPAGLTLNASTGAITGTPTAPGTFTIKLTDANGVVAPGTCPFTIVPAPSVICSTTNTGEVGLAFNSPAMSVSGGTAPYTFSIATGTLPAGLTLNPSTGAITGTPTAAGTFTIKVTDASGVVAPGTCPFTIVPAPSVICSTTNTGEVGLAFNSPAMSVSGGTAPYTFSIATGTLPAGLTLNSSTGAITGTPTAAGTFTIKVTDAAGVVAPGTCPFTIVPAPSVICSTTNTGEVGLAFNSPAMSVSGGMAPYTFSIATGTLPAGLTLNASTGAITGTPTAAGTFTIKVTDAAGVVAPGTCPFTIVPAPSVICSTTNTGEVGLAFNSPAMSVSGGMAPYTFSIATGTLPAGLALNASTGAITGTPTTAGTFTIKVTDAAGVVAPGTCPFTIVPAPSVICSTTNTGEVGLAFNSPAMSVSGGTAPYTFSIATGTLPAGLTLNASTGAITGTPTAAGTFTIKVTDAKGVVAPGTCPFTIVAAPSVICSTTNTGEVGVVFNSPAMSVSGGTAPYTFSIATGTLPAGLTLNASTGAITGTPTAAGTFTIKVTDAAGVVAPGTCPFTIVPAPSVICSTTNSGEVGVAFNSPAMSVSGGMAPYTFSIATGSLPAGLTLNASTGAITGTPTAAGTFTIKLTDAAGVVAPGTCPFTIVAAPSVICSTTNTGEVGLAFNSPAMSVSGGTAPYTFSIATGTLPAGLTLNASTGAITGTPTAAGTFTIKVTDAKGGVAAGTCPFTIVAAPSVICSTTNTGEVGLVFNSPAMSVAGGTAPYTFSIATGTLPAGLTLNASTGAITGTPTAAGTFTIKVTDAKGVVAPGTCPFTIVAPPSLACSTTNAGTAGVAFNSPALTVSGGTAPFTFSVGTGTLPGGLTLNTATGAITGTPTAAGSFTIKVTDAKGVVATTTCPYTIVSAPVCVPTTFNMSGGNSASTGTAGNIRTFTAPSGVQVKASAFSRNKTTGAWEASYLGSYSPGLGVTDSTESGADPTHKVDNVGTMGNYVLFEFSSPVVVDRVYLDSVGADSDMTVWVGTKTNAFTTHNTLSDAFLTSLGASEDSLTGLTAAHWADINAGNVSGNILVIAAKVGDSSDEFKIAQLDISCPGTPAPLSAQCVTATTGNVGVAYSSSITANGGTAPYTFALNSGTLPGGLTLNTSTGAITGTPTTAGSSSFTVKVTDSTGGTKLTTITASCGITIVAPPVCVPTTFNMSGGSSASTGTAGNIRTFTAPSGVQVKASAFSRNKTTGAWEASYLGSYSPGLGVTDSTESGADPTHKVDNVGTMGNYVLFEFSSPVVVNRVYLDSVGADSDLTVWVGTKTNPFTTHNTLSDAFLTSLGASEDNLTSLTVAHWADINAGNVSGNILVVAAKVGDSADEFKIAQLDISCPGTPAALSAQCAAATTGKVGVAYSSSITATGGTAPYTFALNSGTLPGGLTLNTSSGAITGTPTTAGSSSFTVKVTDSTGGTKLTTITASCGITISSVSALTAACPTSTAKVGTAYSSSIGVTGGVGPYTYALMGTLPPGLSLNTTTGAITGTPTSGGTFGFSVKVTDSLGTTALSSCSASCGSNQFIWNFAAPPGNLGTSEPYTMNGIVITAYGFTNANAATALYGNFDGTDEYGLGIAGATDNEIDVSNYVQLDVTNVIAAGATNAMMIVNSVQSGAKYNVYGSNTKGSIGTLLLSNQTANATPFAIPSFPTYKYIAVRAAVSNVLLGAVSFTVGQCTITVNANIANGAYTTYTQGGWGAPPSGTNAAMLLKNNFSSVYPGGSVSIGGTHTSKFTTALAVQNFLPVGGTPGQLVSNTTNPTTSSAGVFAGQVLALQLSVDFSNKGLIDPGLVNLHVVSGTLQGLTVGEVLLVANAVLGGDPLPGGLTLSDLSTIVDTINNNFDGGTVNKGYLY